MKGGLPSIQTRLDEVLYDAYQKGIDCGLFYGNFPEFVGMNCEKNMRSKGKIIPIKPWTDPQVSRRLCPQEFLDSRHRKVGKVVSPTHRPSLTPSGNIPLTPSGNIPGTQFCQRLNRSQGHNQSRSPITKSVIEAATFRLVEQLLTQLLYCVLSLKGKFVPMLAIAIYGE